MAPGNITWYLSLAQRPLHCIPLLSHGPPNTGVPQAGDTKGVFVNNTQMLEVGGPKCPLEPQVHLDLSFLKWHYPSCRSPGRGELRELQWDGEWLYLM